MTKLRRKLQISHFDLIFALRYFALILFPISPGYYSLPRENGEDKISGVNNVYYGQHYLKMASWAMSYKMRARRSVSRFVYCLLGIVAISLYLRFGKENHRLTPDSVTTKPVMANNDFHLETESKFVILQNKSVILILVYTTFSGVEKWINEKGPCYNLNHKISKECPLDKFKLTYDKKRFTESDFVVFEARDMPTLPKLKALLKNRPISQRWVFAIWESPKHFSYTKPFHGLFNLTWTYRRDSDIWGPYGSYLQLSSEDPIYYNKKGQPSDFTRGKSELVAWMVSNCKAKLRLRFVLELKKFIKVDVFGECSERIFGEKRSCPKTTYCLKRYKFYLSFENALCEDYITEKYWDNLGDANVIPVVMGGADYTKLAIPGSYINVLDFKSVKHLAQYLQYLDKNDTAYNEYFKWRKKYKVTAGIGRALCNICQWFVSSVSHGTKVYNDLTEYWVKRGKCTTKNHLIAEMIPN